MKTSVSSKGQVTIPKPIRDRLGITTGTVLEFTERDGELIAHKAGPEDPVTAVYGTLKATRSTDQIMADLRDEPDES